jgi:hypothetical protein
MEEASEVFSMTKNAKSLKTYFMPSNGNWSFEVKDREKILYAGDSFRKAQHVYEKLCRHS